MRCSIMNTRGDYGCASTGKIRSRIRYLKVSYRVEKGLRTVCASGVFGGAGNFDVSKLILGHRLLASIVFMHTSG